MFLFGFSFFLLFRWWRKNTKKLVLMQKQMISTSKRCAEHPSAGQNTQQIYVCLYCWSFTKLLGTIPGQRAAFIYFFQHFCFRVDPDHKIRRFYNTGTHPFTGTWRKLKWDQKIIYFQQTQFQSRQMATEVPCFYLLPANGQMLKGPALKSLGQYTSVFHPPANGPKLSKLFCVWQIWVKNHQC